MNERLVATITVKEVKVTPFQMFPTSYKSAWTGWFAGSLLPEALGSLWRGGYLTCAKNS